MPIFELFVSAGVLFDGTYSLWVSLMLNLVPKAIGLDLSLPRWLKNPSQKTCFEAHAMRWILSFFHVYEVETN